MVLAAGSDIPYLQQAAEGLLVAAERKSGAWSRMFPVPIRDIDVYLLLPTVKVVSGVLSIGRNRAAGRIIEEILEREPFSQALSDNLR
jgi:hypothetical protein